MPGPQSAEALNSLGVGLARQGRIEEAFAHFERALDADAGHVEARLNAARILAAHDYRLDAVQLLLRGFKTRGSDARLRGALAGALEGFQLESAGPEVRAVLLDLAHDEAIATQALADAIVGLLKATPGYPARDVLIAEPLLAALLRRGIVNDESLERALTALRRELRLGGADVPLPFLCALAQQCFNNEYAWLVTPEEAALPVGSDERSLAVAAMYQPLYRIGGVEEPSNPCAAFQDLWRAQVLELREEAAIARTIEPLAPIEDSVSRDVGAMYEENPYPRWQTLQRPNPQRIADGAPRRILIAGCGTGQHPIHVALRFPESEVLAVDLSKASLACATRMARRHGAANLSFLQADLLELARNGDRPRFPGGFDLIESLGVLHHMRDPMAGWRVLTGLLAEAGQMRIGLYSARARAPLDAARAHASAAPDLRAARRAILDLPAGHPARQAADSDDFFSASGFRDLVLHIQEHRYTPLQIADCLRRLGLRFLGFEVSAAERARFSAQHGGASELDLAAWDRFETSHPALFRRMFIFTCAR